MSSACSSPPPEPVCAFCGSQFLRGDKPELEWAATFKYELFPLIAATQTCAERYEAFHSKMNEMNFLKKTTTSN